MKYALTARAMQYMDEYTIGNGIPSAVLMENAARGVVEEIVKRFPAKTEKVLVLAGPGNNGGDAICAARWLARLGYNVRIYFIGSRSRISKEFARQAKVAMKQHPPLEIIGGNNNKSDLSVLKDEYDIIVDGMFGTGLNRRFGVNFSKFIEYINKKKAFKVAVDVPSGLNATTGQAMDAIIKADLTVTFSNYKTGMFFAEGRDACGEIVVVDIGLNEKALSYIDDKLIICDEAFYETTWNKAIRPRIRRSHKGTYGTVGIVVGANGMLGASMLAARAAYRTGCGLVKIFCPSKFIGFFNVSIPEAVAVPYRSEDIVTAFSRFAREVDVILIGPGLPEDSTGKLLVKQVLAGTTPAVLDAGALNIISANLKPFMRRKCECVITPHVGEMARLCNEERALIKKNIIAYTRKFSKVFKVSMVTKSDVSVISLVNSKGDQRMFLNVMGNSGLATAGSGDVLSGVIASLMAQKNPAANSLLYGVMVHSHAADKLGVDENSRRRMMAGDIIDNLF